MHTKTLIFALALSASTVLAQEQQPPVQPQQPPQQETLFKHAHLRGGFGGPIFSWSKTNGQLGYGAGGGGGVVFDRCFVGFFGMGETFDNPLVGNKHLALGYGGLWLGYTTPSHKLLHLYASVKLAGGTAGTAYFNDEWDWEDQWHDITFVAIPEAGLELNIARWMRLSGSVGYRFVEGFDGWENYGKRDLNAATYNITLRFGKFGR